MNIATMQNSAESLKIRLSSVDDAVIDTPAPAGGNLSASDLKVMYKVAVEINRPLSQVKVNVALSYLLGHNTIFSGSLATTFDVVDLSLYITEQEGEDEFRIESDFLPMLISIAFSTTRGYFVRELQGTVLARYPFPMISMDSIQKRVTYQLR